MRFGVHLPLLDWGGSRFSIDDVTAVARAAEAYGLDTICANDHLVYARPWLDGLTALASVISAAPSADLMTSVALPLLRGPVPLAKSLAAIDLLSGGRLIAGLGAGASASEFELVGVPFESRWSRFDEAVHMMRSLLGQSSTSGGDDGDTGVAALEPSPGQGRPPIWIGSWGSERGLHRVAALADGWIASAFNTTPRDFARSRGRLLEIREASGRGTVGLPNALVTMWLFLTTSDRRRQEVLQGLSRMLDRPFEQVAERLPIGPPSLCSEIVARYEEAGVERVVFWPLSEEVGQLEWLAAEVMPSRQTSPRPLQR